MRWRSPLPTYFCFRMLEDGEAKVAFICDSCNEPTARTLWAHIDEDGSSAEIRCPHCSRLYTLRGSRIV